MSVNRNHWSAKEVEILLHYGAEVAVTKLGRSLISCQSKEKALKQEGKERKKRNNRYGFEDQVRILTHSPDYISSYYNLEKVQAINCRNRFKKELNDLKYSNSNEYLKYMEAIDKKGGLWVYGKQKDVKRDITTARYNRLKDKLTFVHEDRVATAEELPVAEPAFLDVPQEAYMPVEIVNHDYSDEVVVATDNLGSIDKVNTPEEAQSFLKRIWNKVSNW